MDGNKLKYHFVKKEKRFIDQITEDVVGHWDTLTNRPTPFIIETERDEYDTIQVNSGISMDYINAFGIDHTEYINHVKLELVKQITDRLLQGGYIDTLIEENVPTHRKKITMRLKVKRR